VAMTFFLIFRFMNKLTDRNFIHQGFEDERSLLLSLHEIA
jgi:hypothetical protein